MGSEMCIRDRFAPKHKVPMTCTESYRVIGARMCAHGCAQIWVPTKIRYEGSEIRDLTCHRHQPRKYGIPYPTEIPCIYSGSRGYDGHFGTSNTSVAHCGCVLEKKCYACFFQRRPRLGVFFFKQKTAYEIGVRLVGSEMCIRDRVSVTSQISDFGPLISHFRGDPNLCTPVCTHTCTYDHETFGACHRRLSLIHI